MLRYKAKLEQCIVNWEYDKEDRTNEDLKKTDAIIFDIYEEFFDKVSNMKDVHKHFTNDYDIPTYQSFPASSYEGSLHIHVTDEVNKLIDKYFITCPYIIAITFTIGYVNGRGDEVPPYADVELVSNGTTVLRVLIPLVRSYFTQL